MSESQHTPNPGPATRTRTQKLKKLRKSAATFGHKGEDSYSAVVLGATWPFETCRRSFARSYSEILNK